MTLIKYGQGKKYGAGWAYGQSSGPEAAAAAELSAAAGLAVAAAVVDFRSYAADANHSGDVQTYIKDVALLGEYPIADDDIEAAGSITMEARATPGELVAGSLSGLLLNNRQVDPVTGAPAPYFSPRKSSFIFGGAPLAWYGKELRVDFGYRLPSGEVSGMITLGLFKIPKWGPPVRAADASGKLQPHTCGIYGKDWIAELFNKKICLPAADGTPQPLTYGEFLLGASAVVGTSPAPVLWAATFADGNYNELDHVQSTGGGVGISLVAPGLTGNYSFRTQTTGANQARYGTKSLTAAGEMFVEGSLCFQDIPATPANANFTFLQLLDAAGSPVVSMTVDNTGAIYESHAGQSKFNIAAYAGVKLPFVIWSDGSHFRFWVNGDEILTWDGSLAAVQTLLFGAMTGATAESWTIDWGGIQIKPKYYLNAYRVDGWPFAAIGQVYIDNVAQPDSVTVGGYTQTLTRFPEWGLVQFTSNDPQFKLSSDVQFRVIMHAGGKHAVDVLAELTTLAGGTPDAATFAAAKAAVPDDLINARFESSNTSNKNRSPIDRAGQGRTVADCLKDICSRMLYWFLVDHGTVRLFAYTGTPPASPVMTLDDDALTDAEPSTDNDAPKTYVAVKWGRYDWNSGLSALIGDPDAGDGEELDFAFGSSPVVIENEALARGKATLFLKLLQAQERWEPVKTKLLQARLELLDPVAVNDPVLMDAVLNCWLTRKELTLDPPRESTLQLLNFLGES